MSDISRNLFCPARPEAAAPGGEDMTAARVCQKAQETGIGTVLKYW